MKEKSKKKGKQAEEKDEKKDVTSCLSCPYKFAYMTFSCTQVSSYPHCVWGKSEQIRQKQREECRIKMEEREKEMLEKEKQQQDRREELNELAKFDPEIARLEAKKDIIELKIQQHLQEKEESKDE